MVFNPPDFFPKEIFSGTHTHVVIEATSRLYYILKLGLECVFFGYHL